LFNRRGRTKITVLKEGGREGGREGERGRSEVMMLIKEPMNPTPTKRKTMVRLLQLEW